MSWKLFALKIEESIQVINPKLKFDNTNPIKVSDMSKEELLITCEALVGIIPQFVATVKDNMKIIQFITKRGSVRSVISLPKSAFIDIFKELYRIRLPYSFIENNEVYTYKIVEGEINKTLYLDFDYRCIAISLEWITSYNHKIPTLYFSGFNKNKVSLFQKHYPFVKNINQVNTQLLPLTVLYGTIDSREFKNKNYYFYNGNTLSIVSSEESYEYDTPLLVSDIENKPHIMGQLTTLNLEYKIVPICSS